MADRIPCFLPYATTPDFHHWDTRQDPSERSLEVERHALNHNRASSDGEYEQAAKSQSRTNDNDRCILPPWQNLTRTSHQGHIALGVVAVIDHSSFATGTLHITPSHLNRKPWLALHTSLWITHREHSPQPLTIGSHSSPLPRLYLLEQEPLMLSRTLSWVLCARRALLHMRVRPIAMPHGRSHHVTGHHDCAACTSSGVLYVMTAPSTWAAPYAVVLR